MHEAMADPAFYKRDGAAIAQTNARLAELESELASVYERWERWRGSRIEFRQFGESQRNPS